MTQYILVITFLFAGHAHSYIDPTLRTEDACKARASVASAVIGADGGTDLTSQCVEVKP